MFGASSDGAVVVVVPDVHVGGGEDLFAAAPAVDGVAGLEVGYPVGAGGAVGGVVAALGAGASVGLVVAHVGGAVAGAWGDEVGAGAGCAVGAGGAGASACGGHVAHRPRWRAPRWRPVVGAVRGLGLYRPVVSHRVWVCARGAGGGGLGGASTGVGRRVLDVGVWGVGTRVAQ